MRLVRKVTMGIRKHLDFYETPKEFTRLLLSYIETDIYGYILEPCNGEGAISHELRTVGFKVKTNDIDKDRKSNYHYDATDNHLWKLSPSWVVSNPPFSSAHRIIPRAYNAAMHGVAFLLRLTYLEPCQNRASFLVKYPPSIVVLPRYSFTKDGSTDSVTCAWFIWNKEYIRRFRGTTYRPEVNVVTKEMVKEYTCDEC